MPTSVLAYGATRAGKTHLLASMRPAGRLCVADVDGKLAAELSDAYTIQAPPVLGTEPAQLEERRRLWAAEFEAANDAPHVIWPIYKVGDIASYQGALAQKRIEDVRIMGIDSLTFAFEKIISHICGVQVMVKKGRDAEEPMIDPVMVSLPDFSGAAVQRAMRMQDWGTFAQKVLEMVYGVKAVAQRLGAHFVCTALEEKRDIIDQKSERLIETRMGPMVQGRAAGPLIPPMFGLFVRLASSVEDGKLVHGCYTQPANGWPAGVVGDAAQKLPATIRNPNLYEMLSQAGLL